DPTNVIADLNTPWMATYTLGGASADPKGYDITEIDSITGHQDYRTQQNIDVQVEFVGTTNFVSLSNGAGFHFTTEPDGTDLAKGSAQMAIVNDTGAGTTPIVTAVKAVRFINLQGDPAFFREFVVTGKVSS